jgi:hypothetical protein
MSTFWSLQFEIRHFVVWHFGLGQNNVVTNTPTSEIRLDFDFNTFFWSNNRKKEKKSIYMIMEFWKRPKSYSVWKRATRPHRKNRPKNFRFNLLESTSSVTIHNSPFHVAWCRTTTPRDTRPTPRDTCPTPGDTRPTPRDTHPTPGDTRTAPRDTCPTLCDTCPTLRDTRPTPRNTRTTPRDTRTTPRDTQLESAL